MPEVVRVGFGLDQMPPPSSSAAGDAEALATVIVNLKLDGGEGRGGGVDGDGDSGCLAPQAEGEEGGRAAEGEAARTMEVSHEYVSGDEAVVRAEEGEESEVDKAWRGQEEWREETEVGKDGAAQEEGEKGAPEDNRKEEEGGNYPHPLRPGEPDCAYYVRTGHCAFGAKCKFNHPLLRGKRALVVKSSEGENSQVKSSEGENSQIKEKEKEENYSSMGQIPCKYYQTPGGCKYGSNCRYMHERKQSEAGPELNFLGLPLRVGQKECPFYMRTGSCKYGSNCRFHHPNPSGMGEQGPVSGYHGNGSSHQPFPGVSLPSTTWRSQGNSNQSVPIDMLGSCVPGILLPHQLHQAPEWNEYQASPNSLYCLEDNKQYPSVQTTYNLSTNANGHSGQLPVQYEDYPHRPDQPECQYYMENGSCRYKSSCWFHHPKDRLARPASCLLSPMGLPLRPDQPVCAYYNRHGICKFGPTCRFNHPMDRSSSKTLSEDGRRVP